jgi:aspartokinase
MEPGGKVRQRRYVAGQPRIDERSMPQVWQRFAASSEMATPKTVETMRWIVVAGNLVIQSGRDRTTLGRGFIDQD